MGGVSAAVSKTAAAPIERIKLLVQNQVCLQNHPIKFPGVWELAGNLEPHMRPGPFASCHVQDALAQTLDIHNVHPVLGR